MNRQKKTRNEIESDSLSTFSAALKSTVAVKQSSLKAKIG